MPNPDSRTASARSICFDVFEFNAETGQLSTQGIPVKLQGKPLQVLAALLQRRGELVTRKELIEKLWPAGTFVDFESSLNTATNRLRAALGDSAETPRYIETLPRLGYRFIYPVSEAVPEESRATPAKPAWGISLAALLISSAFLFIYFAHTGNAGSATSAPSFRQLTFRAGIVRSARFLPGSEGAIYSVKETGRQWRTAVVHLDGSGSHPLDFAAGLLASVSRQGKLALFAQSSSEAEGTIRLSSVSQTSDLIQTLAEGTRAADWLPDGRELAAVREHGAETLVEFPLGHVVYSSRSRIDCLRVSPRGAQIAFLEHPVRDDDGGYVRMVDRQGRARVLSKTWSSADGLAWSPSGDEVWFTASPAGAARALYAVSITGGLRQISHAPSSLRLFDISSTGKVLLAVEDLRTATAAQLAAANRESDVSEFNASHADDISNDGELMLYTEYGDAGGGQYSAYALDGETGRSARFAAGRGLALSPDKRSALTIDPQDRSHLTLTEIKTGESRQILGNGYTYQWAKFLPDGHGLLVGGAFPQAPLTICRQSLDGGKPIPLSGAPYLDYVQISPTGSTIAGLTGGHVVVFELNNKASRPLELHGAALPLAWSSQGLFLLMSKDAGYQMARADLATGAVMPWKTIAPNETQGFAGLTAAVAAPDANAYAYSAKQDLSRLYLVEGW
ncbi:MAG TPA: winged helix-turn-helix domain-containing protein [Bryobacteraceae bacterium]